MEGRNLKVVRGHVVSTGQRVHSTTYKGSSNRTEVVAIPEIWIKNSSGQEQRLAHGSLADCRVGQEVVVIGQKSKNDILAFRNMTTAETIFSREISKLSVGMVQIMSTLMLGVLLMGMAIFYSYGLYGEDWGRKTWQSQFVPQVLKITALVLAVAIPEVVRRKVNNRRSELRSAVQQKLKMEV